MVGLVVPFAMIVVGGLLLAAGLAQGMAGLFILGFVALAVGGVVASRGDIPQDSTH